MRLQTEIRLHAKQAEVSLSFKTFELTFTILCPKELLYQKYYKNIVLWTINLTIVYSNGRTAYQQHDCKKSIRFVQYLSTYGPGLSIFIRSLYKHLAVTYHTSSCYQFTVMQSGSSYSIIINEMRKKTDDQVQLPTYDVRSSISDEVVDLRSAQLAVLRPKCSDTLLWTRDSGQAVSFGCHTLNSW